MATKTSIGYSDLIEEQQRLVTFMEQTYPGRVSAGSLTHQVAALRLECGRTLLRMLKKAQRTKQHDLFAIFESFKNKSNVKQK